MELSLNGIAIKRRQAIDRYEAFLWKPCLLMAEVLDGAESSDLRVRHDSIVQASPDLQIVLDISHVLHARFGFLTIGVIFAMVEPVGGNGIEVWRRLVRKHTPRVHTRCVQLFLGIISSKVAKTEDVLSGLLRWE